MNYLLTIEYQKNDEVFIKEKNLSSKEESIVWKAIAEELLETDIPGTLKATLNNASAYLSIKKRGSFIQNGIPMPSMYVTVDSNDILCDHSDYKEAYLQCINPAGNNYKFYRLLPKYDKLEVEYGSIDADTCASRRTQQPYETYLYWIRYYEKLSKGYNDETKTFLQSKKKVEIKGSKTKTSPLTANAILYQKLMAYARKHVDEVLLQPKMITEKQVKKARKEFEIMCNMKTRKGFNNHLTKLLGYSPRNIGSRAYGNAHLNSLMLQSDVGSKECIDIIAREEKLLLAMEAIIADKKIEICVDKANEDSFEKHNILVFEANDMQKEEVLSYLPDTLKSKIAKIYRIKPINQEKKMREYCKKNNIKEIKKLWHGSVNENWASIIENSLSISAKVANGSMFGRGEYFAPSAHKSFNYTSFRGTTWARGNSNTGFMGLFACAYGNPYFVHSSGDYSQESLKRAGYDCVHAKSENTGLRADEIVFYDEAALCLNYIVEFKAA